MLRAFAHTRTAPLARVQGPSAPRFPTPFRPASLPRPSPMPGDSYLGRRSTLSHLGSNSSPLTSIVTNAFLAGSRSRRATFQDMT